MEFVPGENGEDLAYFTKTHRYEKFYDPIDEMIELHVENHEYEQGETCFSFDSVIELTIKFLRYIDIESSSCCSLPEPHCASDSIVNIQNTEDNCFS